MLGFGPPLLHEAAPTFEVVGQQLESVQGLRFRVLDNSMRSDDGM